MKTSNTGNNHVHPKAAYFIVLVVIFCIHHDLASAGDQQPPVATETTPSFSTLPAHQGAAGMIIYADPQTGETAAPPAAALEDLTVEDRDFLFNALNTSDEGLVEVPSPVPNGGVMVHLQGRFLSPLSITRHRDGQLIIQHRQEPLVADHPNNK